jgi:hypothetical protein
MSYYEPLTRYLAARPTETVVLCFREVEEILGRDLPASARKHQAWWANSPSHSHADAWLRLDWKTSDVDMKRERVTFARDGRRPAPSSRKTPTRGETTPATLELPLEALSTAGRRLLDVYSKEMNGDMAAAAARAVHEAAVARRGRLVAELVATAPRVPPGELDSAALVREDRDAR